MKRLAITWRRLSDDPRDPPRLTIAEPGFVLKIGPAKAVYPTIIASSEILRVDVLDDSEEGSP